MRGSLGQVIRELRRRRGLTQKDLAGPELSKSYISQLERDLVRPSLDTLLLLADRLEVPLTELTARLDPHQAAQHALYLAATLHQLGETEAAWSALARWVPWRGEEPPSAAGAQLSPGLATSLAALAAEIRWQLGDEEGALQLAESAMAAADDAPAEARVRALLVAGQVYLARALILRAHRAWEEAATLVERAPDEVPPTLRRRLYRWLADVHQRAGDPDLARHWEEAERRLRAQVADLPAAARYHVERARRLGERPAATLQLAAALALAEAAELLAEPQPRRAPGGGRPPSGPIRTPA